MRIAYSSSRLGGLHQPPPPPEEGTPQGSTPQGGTPWEQTPPPPRKAPPRGRYHPEEAPLPGNGADHPPVNRITDACENITLPQLRCRR